MAGMHEMKQWAERIGKTYRGSTATTAAGEDGSAPDAGVLLPALSSLLAGIGDFEGNLLVRVARQRKIADGISASAASKKKMKKPEFEEKRWATKRLLSGTPSRPFFPRGFLWDEGFHGLVFALWEPELFMEICADWLLLQDPDHGWIPREVALGPEAESRVPPQFLPQSFGVANPPTLLFGIRYLISGLVAPWMMLGSEESGLSDVFVAKVVVVIRARLPCSFRFRSQVVDVVIRARLVPPTTVSGVSETDLVRV